MKTKQEHIDDIMDNFDFRRMLKMMHAVGWTWGAPAMIPDESDLRSNARKKLSEAWDKCESGSCSLSSGGIEAIARIDESGKWLELRFDAVSWETSE